MHAKQPACAELNALVRELRAENKRLHLRAVKLEVELISLKHRTSALEKEMRTRNNVGLKQILDDISSSAGDA